MAEDHDTPYFPTLGECLRGDTQLFSWKTLCEILCHTESLSKSDTAITGVLAAPEVHAILNSLLSPFGSPDTQGKGSFEKKTAPIVVPQTGNGDYDIKELKEDALWLSKTTKINEVAALRITLLEWQTRDAALLLSGLTEDETINGQENLGATKFGSSIFQQNSSIFAAPVESPGKTLTSFSSVEQRRQRLIETFFLEKTHILKASECLLRWHVESNHCLSEWDSLRALGSAVHKHQDPQVFLLKCIETIQEKLSKFDSGSGWFTGEEENPAAEETWAATQLLEISYILRLMFTHLTSEEKFLGFDVPNSSLITGWFDLMHQHSFLKDLQPIFGDHLSSLIQCLISLVSLAILRLPSTLPFLNTSQARGSPESASSSSKQEFVLDSRCVSRVSTILVEMLEYGTTPASFAIFGWSIMCKILRENAMEVKADREYRNSQDGLDQPTSNAPQPSSLLEDALTAIMDVRAEDIIEYLGATSISSIGIFSLIKDSVPLLTTLFGANIDKSTLNQMRLSLMDLIRFSTDIVLYSVEVVEATLAILAPGRNYWDIIDSKGSSDPVVNEFAEDITGLQYHFLRQAQERYPYETEPLLRFCSALSLSTESLSKGTPWIRNSLQEVSILTQIMPLHFVDYELREDEYSNRIRLTQDLSLFSGLRMPHGTTRRDTGQLVLSGTGAGGLMAIPCGTEGTVLDDSKKPHIVSWEFRHSALQYLAILLSTVLVGNPSVEHATQTKISPDDAAEIVGLFATFIAMPISLNPSDEKSRKEGAREIALSLLEETSFGVNRGHDLIDIVFAIFEQEMQRLPKQTTPDSSLRLIISCIQFIHAVTRIYPNRVWPWLTRSRLLDIDGNASSLVAIVVSIEMVLGQYSFLLGCIRFFEALVDDIVTHAILRKQTSKMENRWESSTLPASGSSEKAMNRVLLEFTRTLIGVLESLPSWKFIMEEEKYELNSRLTSLFNQILSIVYGCVETDSSSRIAGTLTKPAEYLVETFLSTEANDLCLQPLLSMTFTALGGPTSVLSSRLAELCAGQSKSALTLCTTLVRIAILLSRPSSYLETQLFKAAPFLARLYVTSEQYKAPVANLLESLIRSAGRTDAEPPSLLGHLGSATAKSFLSVLSKLDHPVNNVEVETDIWKMLSAAISSKQQGFAICLLTGHAPRDSVKKKHQPEGLKRRGIPLLMIAMDKLCDLGNPNRANALLMDPKLLQRSLSTLEFVNMAQNHWPWAVSDLRTHPNFLKSIMEFIDHLQWNGKDEPVDTAVLMSYKLAIAASIAEILAMHLHHSRQMGDLSAVKDISGKLSFIKEHGASRLVYRPSLHANLKSNLARKFNDCSITSFKRSSIVRSQLGQDYYYDTELARKVLDFDKSFLGERGMYEEIRLANVNLSLIESQILLLKSWKLLATELSNCIGQEPKRLPKLLITAAKDCLIANDSSTGAEQIFEMLARLRVDFAFVLVQRLVQSNCTDEDAKSLLGVVWNSIRACAQDSEYAFVNEDVDYYRILLKILFLALRLHISSGSGLPSGATTPLKATDENPGRQFDPSLLDLAFSVIINVVAKGFRSLAKQVHDDIHSCSPSDFVLLTAIFQTLLRVPGMHTMHKRVTLYFSNNNMIRYTTSLFSWSHQLMIDRDPIYGELSILFLLELSSMPSMAQSLADEGILSQLSTAPLINYFRRPNGMSPTDEPSRLFSIWSRGILPLCLNLLDAVGAPMAAEIAAFLNQFPSQLSRAAASLGSRAVSDATRGDIGYITLGVASEAHSLALITLILHRHRISGPTSGILASDIPQLDWDNAAVKEDIEGWLRGRRALRDRIAPVNEREAALTRLAPMSELANAENRLEERVVVELSTALECLNSCAT